MRTGCKRTYIHISESDRCKQVLYTYIRSIADEKEGRGRSELLPVVEKEGRGRLKVLHDDGKIGRMKWILYKTDWKDGRGHKID